MEQEENQQEIKFCIKCSKSEIPEDADPHVGLYGSVLKITCVYQAKDNGKCVKREVFIDRHCLQKHTLRNAVD